MGVLKHPKHSIATPMSVGTYNHILMAYIWVLSLYYKNYKCVNIEGSVTVTMVSHRGRESVKFQFLRRL